MDDERIIELYWQRDESAITATDAKYGALLRALSRGIVLSREDAEECVNDTYMALWSAIPPKWPERLRAYAAATARNISLRRYRDGRTQRRGAGEVPLALDELGDAVPSDFSVESAYACARLAEELDRFLERLGAGERRIFMSRYWLLCPVADIAARSGFSEAKVKTTLHRTRQKLKKHLEKEGLL